MTGPHPVNAFRGGDYLRWPRLLTGAVDAQNRPMKNRFFVPALALALSATVSLAAEPRLGLETQYFAGDSVVQDAAGQTAGTSKIVIKRQIWTREKMILEDSVIRYSGPGATPDFYLTVSRWDGDRMHIVEKTDSFRGQGTLVGEEGHWTAWNSQSQMADGVRIESDDHLLADHLETHKRLFKPTGELIFDIHENLKLVSEAEFQKAWQQASQKQ